MAADQVQESRDTILPVAVAGRHFRVHLNGPASQMGLVTAQIGLLQSSAADEDEFIVKLADLCAAHGVTLGDLLDLTTPSSRGTLAEQFRVASHARTASLAFIMIQGILEGATDDEYTTLIQSRDLGWVRDYLESVLCDLDEDEQSARESLQTGMPEHIAYLLLN